MKICERGAYWLQIINGEGDVRGCSWARNNYYGNIIKNDIKDVYHSELAKNFRNKRFHGDYSECDVDNCPYLANNSLDEVMVDECSISDAPQCLLLAYEGVCNYKCICCTSYENMKCTKENDYSSNYEIIEERIRKYLPYIKNISANGRGELFVSKRILNILSNWKPLSPPEEISVVLETNGSLFDEEHWRQIENLGQYNLRVVITIMSFNESVYQYLSGVKYPISKIKDNLRFVKNLKEKGIINELVLATVLQEQNFREMPEFTKKCIEEFGADLVRIRPIFPGGRLNKSDQWFMDVRNPEHPYYNEYKKVMANSIFRHPKVLLWSGEEDSELGEHPWKKQSDLVTANYKNEVIVSNLLSDMIMMDNMSSKLEKYFEENGIKSVAIYGVGKLGKAFLREGARNCKCVKRIYDNKLAGMYYEGFLIEKMDILGLEEMDAVILTPILCKTMEQELGEYQGRILYMCDLLGQI